MFPVLPWGMLSVNLHIKNYVYKTIDNINCDKCYTYNKGQKFDTPLLKLM